MRTRLMGITVGVAAAMVAMGGVSYAADAAEMLKDVKVSGYVDTTYTYNLNDPQSGENQLRLFDHKANSFLLSNSELSFMKSPEAGGAGFGLVLNYGTDAQVTQAGGSTVATSTSTSTSVSTPPPTTTTTTTTTTTATKNDFDIQEGYAAYGFKSGKGWWRFGKFVTMHGAEVIKSTGDYNISRSFLFNYAIPFTHTGLRVHYEMGPNLSGHFGVNNGWDNLKDDGKGKTAELQVGLSLPDMLALSVTGMYGPEASAVGQDNRGLIDVVATLTPVDNVTVVFNYDRGSQTNGVAAGSPAFWQGYAAYLNMGLGEKHSATIRGEIFDDHDGLRTQVDLNGDGISDIVPRTLKEVTLTLSCKQVENLEMRAEYRYDMSNQNVFQDDKALPGVPNKDTQSTVGVQLIYSF